MAPKFLIIFYNNWLHLQKCAAMLEFNDIIIWQKHRDPGWERVCDRLQSEAERRDGKASAAAAEVGDLLWEMKRELSRQEQWFLMQDV